MTEVAHDHQVQVKKYVVDELKLKNSSDTWHGMFVYVCVLYGTNRIWKYRVCVYYCTWYGIRDQCWGSPGTKGVAKAMKKIAQGPQSKEGDKWFLELSDKRKWSVSLEYHHWLSFLLIQLGKSTKTHLYWAMKNCDGTGDDLRKRIMNILKHYQV